MHKFRDHWGEASAAAVVQPAAPADTSESEQFTEDDEPHDAAAVTPPCETESRSLSDSLKCKLPLASRDGCTRCTLRVAPFAPAVDPWLGIQPAKQIDPIPSAAPPPHVKTGPRAQTLSACRALFVFFRGVG